MSYDGHGRIVDPTLNHDGRYVEHRGYITDIMNELAVDFLERKRAKPFSLFFAHKAVHPDAQQAADGTFGISTDGGYIAAERHRDLYRDAIFPKSPNMLAPGGPPEASLGRIFGLKGSDRAAILAALHGRAGGDPATRANDGVGRRRHRRHPRSVGAQDKLDETFIVFLGDNGYFFGEHALGPERRFAYEEGIRSPFVVRYPRKVKAGTRRRELVICQDIAPTLIDLAGSKPGPQIQGRSLLPLFTGKRTTLAQIVSRRVLGRAGDAVARRHDVQGSAHRPPQVHPLGQPRQRGELDELYDLDSDPYELKNLKRSRAYAPVRDKLRRELCSSLPKRWDSREPRSDGDGAEAGPSDISSPSRRTP